MLYAFKSIEPLSCCRGYPNGGVITHNLAGGGFRHARGRRAPSSLLQHARGRRASVQLEHGWLTQQLAGGGCAHLSDLLRAPGAARHPALRPHILLALRHSTVEVAPWQRPSCALAPPQRALGGSGQLGTPGRAATRPACAVPHCDDTCAPLRAVRPGYTYAPPARRTYPRHRAAGAPRYVHPTRASPGRAARTAYRVPVLAPQAPHAHSSGSGLALAAVHSCRRTPGFP